jgi:7-carboxy-7-deazaguanine synthase
MTQFIRMAGCNLRCPGWPCDTQHAIDPALYRHEWQVVSPGQVLERVQEYPKRVTLTGGEPFLQPRGEMEQLISALVSRDYTVEAFTNGTTEWPDAIEYWKHFIRIIMDWKLEGSGEDPLNATRLGHLEHLGSKDAVKFVIKDENDFTQAVHLWQDFIARRLSVQVYYGAVWGTIENSKLVEWVQREHLDWVLNVQVHNYIYDRNERGI